MIFRFHGPGSLRNRGFTLLEMLVSIGVLAIIMVLTAQMIGATEKLWKSTSSRIDAFQGARAGFELMTDELRQSSVNTYYDYFDASGNSLEQFNALNAGNSTASYSPVSYGRQSELHFISGPVNGGTTTTASGSSLGPNLSLLAVPQGGTVVTHGVFFQYPQGYTEVTGNPATATQGYGVLPALLNATGYFIEFGPDIKSGGGAWVANGPPTFVTLLPGFQPSYRFRLMQFFQPTEDLSVYNYSTTSSTAANDWFTTPIASSHSTNVRIVADNIIALIIWPKEADSPTDTLAPGFIYDSRLGAKSGTNIWSPSSGLQPLQMNQMPPLLKVAMVAIDEPSAKALQGSSTAPPPAILAALAASNPGTGVNVFTVAQNMDSDIAYLQTKLASITPHVSFRTFNTTIAVRSAKFSK